jgi:hypothetical protein
VVSWLVSAKSYVVVDCRLPGLVVCCVGCFVRERSVKRNPDIILGETRTNQVGAPVSRER